MADNITLANGKIVATKEVAGVHFPRTIISFAGVDAAAGAGEAGATTLRVVLASLARNFTTLAGTITTGGTAQDLIAAASGYVFVSLANPSDASESLFFNDTGADCTNNPAVDEELTPGMTYIWSATGVVPVPTDKISIGAATTGHAFRAKRA